MKPTTIRSVPPIWVFLASMAVFLVTACTTSDTQAEGADKTSPSPAPILTGRPIVLTQIKTEPGSSICTAEFENNNCGALGNPGDICLQAGGGGTNTKGNLKFVVAGPGANNAEIQKMKIGIGVDWDCPDDTDKDFPQFTNCEYEPTGPGNVMHVEDHNHLTRTWSYSLTVKAKAGCDPIVIHPIIDNGGGNSSSDDPP